MRNLPISIDTKIVVKGIEYSIREIAVRSDDFEFVAERFVDGNRKTFVGCSKDIGTVAHVVTDFKRASEIPVTSYAVGKVIRDLRKRRHQTIGALARSAGVTIGCLSDIERELKRPTLWTIESVARAMGMSLVDFFEEAESFVNR